MSTKTAKRARALIAETLLCDPKDVTDDAELVERLEADSLEITQLVLAIEEVFGFDIPDDDAEAWKTAGDVIQYIERRLTT